MLVIITFVVFHPLLGGLAYSTVLLLRFFAMIIHGESGMMSMMFQSFENTFAITNEENVDGKVDFHGRYNFI